MQVLDFRASVAGARVGMWKRQIEIWLLAWTSDLPVRIPHAAFCMLLCWLPVAVLAQGAGYATVTGTVVDAETGAALPGANVFIAESLLGTATDADGRFQLDNVPLGAHRLYVSMLGFVPVAETTVLRTATTHTFAFRLEPTVLELEGLTVTAERDKRWRRNLQRFLDDFVGTSDFAAQTTLTNPEVLRFAGRRHNLSARASAPLVIENRALGYRLTYFLEEFERDGGTVRYDGEPLFEPLHPADDLEAARWAENRRRAFYGSFRHLMLSLLADEEEAQGFRTFRIFSLDDINNPSRRHVLDAQTLFQPSGLENEWVVRFPGIVEVVYLEEHIEDAYWHWQGQSRKHRPTPQRSWFRLTDGPTSVDHMGEIIDPYGITVYGYFAFEGIGELLPKEYRP